VQLRAAAPRRPYFRRSSAPSHVHFRRRWSTLWPRSRWHAIRRAFRCEARHGRDRDSRHRGRAQRTVLAAWLMPAGAAIGASTRLAFSGATVAVFAGAPDEHACRVGGLLNTAMETPAWRHGADRSSEAIAVCVRRATRARRGAARRRHYRRSALSPPPRRNWRSSRPCAPSCHHGEGRPKQSVPWACRAVRGGCVHLVEGGEHVRLHVVADLAVASHWASWFLNPCAGLSGIVGGSARRRLISRGMITATAFLSWLLRNACSALAQSNCQELWMTGFEDVQAATFSSSSRGRGCRRR
jgi:hypothetical protein